MSLDQQLLQQVAALTATVNAIQQSAKTNDELAVMSPLDGDAKARVYIDGQSKSITLQQIISAAIAGASPYNDKILHSEGFSLEGQDLTLFAGWEWVINTNQYTNLDDVVLTIPLAATGHSRIDLIIATTTNTFMRIPGFESESTPVSPELPLNTVLATFVTVSDSGFTEPFVPNVGKYLGLFDSVEEFEIYLSSGTISRVSNGDFAIITDGIIFKLAARRQGTWIYKDVGGSSNLPNWHEAYVKFEGDPIEVPLGFVGTVMNMDAPQSVVTTTVTATELTVTGGATTDDLLRVFGINP